MMSRSLSAIAGRAFRIDDLVTKRLCERLSPLRHKVDAARAEPFDDLNTPLLRRDYVTAAAHLFPAEAFDLSRILTVLPPAHIHRMQRNARLWIGDLYSANVVIHALARSGVGDGAQTVLDLGCSSGSLGRVLAAYDEWKVLGCDPIAAAVEWARENIPTGEFFHMGTRPPLELDDGSVDGVTAISVWSHHRADAAKIWADEVARILSPGGWFVVTFSSLHHVSRRAGTTAVTAAKTDKMLHDMAETGCHFVAKKYGAEASETGEDWGEACYTRERFFSLFLDRFDVAGYFPGMNQGNQDVAVFVKR